MKNFKNILCLLAIPLLLFACKKDFLQMEPVVGSTEANFYQTAGDAESAIIACYNPLQQEVTNIQGTGQLAAHFRWYFGDIVSDDSHKGGSGDGDEPELFQFENFQGTSASKIPLGEWQAAYRAIAYCNIALEKIPGIEMDEDIKVRYLAEASFIRAYSYQTLVTMFGGVPLILESLAPSEYQQARATASEVWSQIESDYLDAMANLPQRSEIGISDLGRATHGAAAGMLTKAYLYQGKFGEAQSTAELVINSGEYFLDPNYQGIFTQSGENGPGSVFEIQYMNASGGNWGNQLEGTFSNIFQRARGSFNGYGFNIPTQELVDEYEASDPRMSATIFSVGDQMGDRGTFTLEATGFPHEYYARKHFINQSEEAPFGDAAPNGPTNDRVLRFADVLLMHAEAAYQNGAEGLAQASLNEVRARARDGNEDILPDVTASGSNLLDAIYHERRVELALEGHRFFDIVRQGRAEDLLAAQGLNYNQGVHGLFPIPQIEITLSGGLITQNPGY